jgi:hypothetical protein
MRRNLGRRKLSGVIVPVLAAVTILFLSSAANTLIAQSSSAQTHSAVPAKARTFKTPWGEPDIQGIWSNAQVVPFERPKKYGNREFMTEEEHQKAVETLVNRDKENSVGRDSRKGRDTEKDVARAYNQFWFGMQTTNVSYRTSQIIDPPDGRMPAYTPEARARIQRDLAYKQALLQGTSGGRPGPISPMRYQPPPDYNFVRLNRVNGPEDRSVEERCFMSHLPIIMGAGPLTPDGRPVGSIAGAMRIVESPESVDFYYDIGQGSGFNRVVQITRRPHLPQNIRQYWGDSIGHWEGDTLVVDTTNFTKETDFRGSHQNLHLIERYRRVNTKTLEITTTVEDPTTWVAPFTFVQDLSQNSDKANMVYEGGCWEGDYALLDMLANTRAADKLFSEGKGPDPAREDLATGGGGHDEYSH